MKHKKSVTLIIGICFLSIIFIAAALSFFWLPFPPDEPDPGLRLSAPDSIHWAGTDKLGRDLFSQLLIGARYVFYIAVTAPLIAAAIGIPLGIIAASSRRTVDEGLSFIFDAMIAFPSILLAMLVVTVRGASMSSAVIAIGISASAPVARVTRVNTLAVLAADYVRAAYACGVPKLKIILRHVLPNISPIITVQLILIASGAILAEASLAYLGLGAPPPRASWGRLLMEAQSSVMTAPWGAIIPGCAIVTAVLSLNFLGDGLRELLDPQEEVSI